jgi:hypothetical protein
VTKKQQELAEKQGTPEQFEEAIWKACDDLFITTQEAVAAINRYENEWRQAGHIVNEFMERKKVWASRLRNDAKGRLLDPARNFE